MEQEEVKDRLVLVGFGDNKLKDMMGWIDTERELELLIAFKKWPPVYREEKACEPEDIKAAFAFLEYLQEVITEYEKNEEK